MRDAYAKFKRETNVAIIKAKEKGVLQLIICESKTGGFAVT